MNEAGKAVFLSYASQDAPAAKKICEALRAAGVEVWFDTDGGLEHGDEWDAKIRRQIKECVLFLAIVSANTQAREEGYFRIEWDLAAERARGIASGVAFILPVVIDDTREPDALVPDRFRTVQWTRMPGGAIPPEVLQRFLKLWSHRAGAVSHAAAASSRPAESRPPAAAEAGSPPPGRGAKPAVLAAAGLLILAAAAVVWWRGSSASPSPAPAAEKPAATAAAPAGFPRDPELRRARKLIYGLDAIQEDFALAEDIVKPVLAQRPNDPEAVTVAAEVAQEYMTRGFDLSTVRRREVQRLTERAALLAPDNPAALGALARYLIFINTQPERAEELAKRAIELAPDDSRYYRMLYSLLAIVRPGAEADEFRARMIARFPRDPLVVYDIARAYKDANDWENMERWFDRTLELAPVATALTWKSWVELEIHGNPAGMRPLLERVPERQRLNSRVVNAFYVEAMISRNTGAALSLLNGFGETWMTDFDFTGPKALLIGDLLRIEGREDLARAQYEKALAEVERVVAQDPTEWRPRRAEVLTLIALNRRDEARASLRIVIQSQPRPYRWTFNNSWWNGSIRACLLMDERAMALELLKESTVDPSSRRILRNLMRIDPAMAPFRDDPAIVAALAEPAAPSAPAETSPTAAATPPPDAKSIAVLPFANLSTEKENEFFVDGLHADVITNLAKVRALQVISRTSVLAYRDPGARNLKKIASELGVATVLEGTVRRVGPKVHMNAQLVDARTDQPIWADSFDGDAGDIFALQAKLAQQIAGALKATLTPGERTLIERRPTENAEAYALYLRARTRQEDLGEVARIDDYNRLLAMYEQVLAMDPNFSLAHAQIAYVNSILYWFGYFDPSAERAARVKAAVDAAVRLAPNAPETHLAAGLYQYRVPRNWAAALEEYRVAEAGLPNDAQLVFLQAVALRRLGRWAEAQERFDRAVALNPRELTAVENALNFLVSSRHYLAARRLLDKSRSFFPGVREIVRYQALTDFALDGDIAGLSRALAQLPADDSHRYGGLDRWQAAMVRGDFAEADRVLAPETRDALADVYSANNAVPIPTALYRAHVAFLRGDSTAAAALARETEAYFGRGIWNDRQRPWVRVLGALARSFGGATGATVTDAESALREMREQDKFDGARMLGYVAMVQVLAGRKDAALATLRDMMQSPSDLSPREIRINPILSRLKDDPRFEEILASAKEL